MIKRLEAWWKKALIDILALFLKRSIAKISRPELGRPLKVLFIRPERIGDTLISFPVVDFLKKTYPSWEISWLTSPRSYELVAEDPRYKNVYLYTKRIGKDLAMIWRARQERFDIAINLIRGDSVTSLLLAHWLAPKAFKIGVGSHRHVGYYHSIIANPFSTPNRHILDNTLDLAELLGADAYMAERFCPVYVSRSKWDTISSFLSGLPERRQGSTIIGVNVSSGEMTRTWSLMKFRSVIERLLCMKNETRFIIFASPSEYDCALEMANTFVDRVFIPPRPIDICTVAGLISKLHLLISTDTSLLHIARTYRIPVVGLYRYNTLNTWCPYAQRSGVIMSPTEEHLFDITVEQVVEKTIEIGQRFKIPGLMHV